MARPDAAAKRKAQGGRQISASFTAEEIMLLEAAKEAGGFETNKAAIIAGLKGLREKAAASAALSQDAVIDWIRTNTKAKGK